MKKTIGALKYSWIFLLIFGGYFMTWVIALQSSSLLTLSNMSGQILGAMILVTFSIVFVLSTKWSFLPRLLGGLENVYFYHRWLAMIAIGLIFIHAEITDEIMRAIPWDLNWLMDAEDAGELSQSLFIIFIAIIPLNRIIKYDNWKILHRLLVIPFIIGAYHSYFSSSVNMFALTPVGISSTVMLVIGIYAGIYIILIYPWVAFKNNGTITAFERLNAHTFDLHLTMKKPYHYDKGQYAFIKIIDEAFPDEMHPFSISGGGGNTVKFTIKVLGDYTDKMYQACAVGMKVKLSRAHGHMAFGQGNSRQLWIGGGVGITPFLSYVRDYTPLDLDVDLYYSTRSVKDGIFISDFNEAQKLIPGFHFHHIATERDGRLNLETLDLTQYDSVYLCGPDKMVHAMESKIHKLQPRLEVHSEAFSFMGTIIDQLSAYINQFKQWAFNSLKRTLKFK